MQKASRLVRKKGPALTADEKGMATFELPLSCHSVCLVEIAPG
jgi:hypothetical protein